MIAALVSCALSLSLAVGPSQLLGDPAAQQAFEEAQAAFEAKDYATASAKLERAYMLEPKPELLYPWAQAERNLGRCASAIDLYQKFIDTGPPERMVEAARQNITRCEESLAAAQPEPEPAAPAEDPESAPRRDRDEPVRDDGDEPRPVGRDPAGASLVAVGGVGVIVGAALLGVASGRARQTDDAADNQAYLDVRHGALALRNGGAAALAIGGALLLAGVVRYGVLAGKRKRSRSDVGLLLPRGGAGLAWTHRF
ncbi:MAG: hypothetical protein K1X88_16910 [Nannocystaceae bacterium]|nr:hypothetical protein [Nannocystaceae bacterium]